MAMNKEQAEEILEAAKALALEHGDVRFFFAVKDKDDNWRYAVKMDIEDGLLIIKTLAQDCAESMESESGGEPD